jgi:hypothetical protein
MEPNMKNNNNKRDKKYNVYQIKKEYDSELINNYRKQNDILNVENKEFRNGSRKDKNNIINNKRCYVINSLNAKSIENKNKNNINENNAENVYHTQLIKNRNHNYLITGKTGSHSISNKYGNNSLSKKDSKNTSDMAKTLKIYGEIKTKFIDISDDKYSQKEKDINKNLKNDNSSDKISIISGKNNNKDKNTNYKKLNIKNIDPQRKNNKKLD